MSGNVHEAKVLQIRQHTVDIFEYRLRAEAPLRFRPGQFVSVRVGVDASGDPILRSYSIASSPGPSHAPPGPGLGPETEEIVVLLKHIPGGPGSRFFAALAEGASVSFTGPMGFFVLDFSHPGDVVFGVTGVGITPVLPMLAELAARAETGRILVYWGNRRREDLFWQRELEEAQARCPRLRIDYFLSAPDEAWAGRRGRISPALLEELPSLVRPVFYLVGNGEMIREVKAALQERGVDRKRQIRNEAFYP